jgi:hypothetical protein
VICAIPQSLDDVLKSRGIWQIQMPLERSCARPRRLSWNNAVIHTSTTVGTNREGPRVHQRGSHDLRSSGRSLRALSRQGMVDARLGNSDETAGKLGPLLTVGVPRGCGCGQAGKAQGGIECLHTRLGLAMDTVSSILA